MGLREVLEWEFQTVERRALRDGKKTSKMKVVKSKKIWLLGHLIEDPGASDHPHTKEILLGCLFKNHTGSFLDSGPRNAEMHKILIKY